MLCLQATKQLTRVARLIVISAQHISRHRLAEPSAAGDAAIAALGIESLVDKWNQRCLVHILAIHDVTKLTVASIDICTHNFFAYCRRDKPASDCKDTHLLYSIQTFHVAPLIYLQQFNKQSKLCDYSLMFPLSITIRFLSICLGRVRE